MMSIYILYVHTTDREYYWSVVHTVCKELTSAESLYCIPSLFEHLTITNKRHSEAAKKSQGSTNLPPAFSNCVDNRNVHYCDMYIFNV